MIGKGTASSGAGKARQYSGLLPARVAILGIRAVSKIPENRLVPRILLIFLLTCCLSDAQSGTPWRYDLRPGDRLVYSYLFRREVHSDRADSTSEARFHSQVLIAGARDGVISAGFQRNRDSAELQMFRVKGKDKLPEERPKFQKRMQARPAQFSEAMEFNLVGEPRFSWEASRESPSYLLPGLHEIEVLPVNAPKVGERWPGMNLLGIEFEFVGTEIVHGKTCYRAKAATRNGSVMLSYWWSPESGMIERLEFDGAYPIPGGTSHETARIDLESTARNESVSDWLAKQETRQGALEALLLSPGVPVTPEQLGGMLNLCATDTILDSAQGRPVRPQERSEGSCVSPPVRRLALAVARRRRLSLPTSTRETDRGSPETSAVAERSSVRLPGSGTICPESVAKKIDPEKFGTLLRVAPTEKAGQGIPYFLRIPLSYQADRPTPLLVYLSGGAGRALDAVNTANDVIAATDYLVLYPQAGEYWWNSEVAQRLDVVMRDVFNEFNVDRDRVYIAGFSNGGTGALYMAGLWPHRFAAVVSLMGAGQCTDEVRTLLPNLAHVPLLFVHGERDALIAAECSQATYDAIRELSPSVGHQLRLLPDREHDITLASDDGLTLGYIKDKVRDPFPKRVDAKVPELAFPRQYWVELLGKKTGVAEVTAEIKRDNTVEIRSREVTKLRLYLRPEMFPQARPVRVRWNGRQVFEGPMQDVCATVAAQDVSDPKLDLADRREFSLP